MLKKIVPIMALITVVGCASVAETTTSNSSMFKVYQVDVPDYVEYRRVAQAVKSGLAQVGETKRLVEFLPPAPLPEQAPRFSLINPVGKQSLKNGLVNKRPSCNGALVYTKTETFGAGQESDALYTCLWKYQEGYHLDIYYMPGNSSKTSNVSFGHLFSNSNSSTNTEAPKLMTDAIQGIQANFSNLSANTSLIDSSRQIEAI